MYRRSLAITASVATVLAMSAAPAMAGHDHFIVTPNGQCHQVASGQTSIEDSNHGGHHRFHANVHLGASGADAKLGKGMAAVQVFKGADAPEICF